AGEEQVLEVDGVGQAAGPAGDRQRPVDGGDHVRAHARLPVELGQLRGRELPWRRPDLGVGRARRGIVAHPARLSTHPGTARARGTVGSVYGGPRPLPPHAPEGETMSVPARTTPARTTAADALPPLVLALDVGSTATRAGLYDAAGR